VVDLGLPPEWGVHVQPVAGVAGELVVFVLAEGGHLPVVSEVQIGGQVVRVQPAVGVTVGKVVRV
jgi:hypothetical protein